MTRTSYMAGLERIVSRLPEAERVDIADWGDHPTFRVRGKNFVFCDADAVHLSVKLPKDEAEAVVATDSRVEPAGYGLGRHGWIAVTLSSKLDRRGWRELEEWVRTSYTLVAPKSLARIVLEADSHQRLLEDGGDSIDREELREGHVRLAAWPGSVPLIAIGDLGGSPAPSRPPLIRTDADKWKARPDAAFESSAWLCLGRGQTNERQGGRRTPTSTLVAP